MPKHAIKQVDVVSVVKFSTAINAILAALLGLPLFIAGSSVSPVSIGIGYLSAILVAIFFGAIIGTIIAAGYNLLADATGGIIVESERL